MNGGLIGKCSKTQGSSKLHVERAMTFMALQKRTVLVMTSERASNA